MENVVLLLYQSLDRIRHAFGAVGERAADPCRGIGDDAAHAADRLGDGSEDKTEEVVDGLADRLAVTDVLHIQPRQRQFHRSAERGVRERQRRVLYQQLADHHLRLGSVVLFGFVVVGRIFFGLKPLEVALDFSQIALAQLQFVDNAARGVIFEGTKFYVTKLRCDTVKDSSGNQHAQIQKVYITTDNGISGWLDVTLESGTTVANPMRYGM